MHFPNYPEVTEEEKQKSGIYVARSVEKVMAYARTSRYQKIARQKPGIKMVSNQARSRDQRELGLLPPAAQQALDALPGAEI